MKKVARTLLESISIFEEATSFTVIKSKKTANKNQFPCLNIKVQKMRHFTMTKRVHIIFAFAFVGILFIVSEEGSDFSAKVSDVAPLTLF